MDAADWARMALLGAHLYHRWRGQERSDCAILTLFSVCSALRNPQGADRSSANALLGSGRDAISVSWLQLSCQGRAGAGRDLTFPKAAVVDKDM